MVMLNTLINLELINMPIKSKHTKMLRLDKLVTIVSCAAHMTPVVPNVLSLTKRKPNAQETHSAS